MLNYNDCLKSSSCRGYRDYPGFSRSNGRSGRSDFSIQWGQVVPILQLVTIFVVDYETLAPKTAF